MAIVYIDRLPYIHKEAGNSSPDLAGTITSAGGTNITGTGTTFQDDFVVGDYVEAGAPAQRHKIASITSQTLMTVEVAGFSPDVSGATYRRVRIEENKWEIDAPINLPLRIRATVKVGTFQIAQSSHVDSAKTPSLAVDEFGEFVLQNPDSLRYLPSDLDAEVVLENFGGK